MKSKLTFIFLTLLFTSCQNTFIYAPKCVHASGDNNAIEIKGSDLEGNNAEQKSESKIKSPLLK